MFERGSIRADRGQVKVVIHTLLATGRIEKQEKTEVEAQSYFHRPKTKWLLSAGFAGRDAESKKLPRNLCKHPSDILNRIFFLNLQAG